MVSTQQPITETGHKVAILRGLLQKPSSKHVVAPLVTALMARDVDIHERMLTDLGSRVQQMEGSLKSDSEHTTRVLERMHSIEQDAKGLRELIQAEREKDIDAGFDPAQLQAQLTEAIKLHSTEIIGVGKRLQIVQDTMEGQQQTASRVVQILDSIGQRMESLQRDIDGLKNGLEKAPFATPMIERLVKLEEGMTKYFGQTSKDAGIIKISLAAIKMKSGSHEEVEYAAEQRTEDVCTLGGAYTRQSELPSSQPNLEDWPAIAQFVTIYERFLENYKSKKPENDLDYIDDFLHELNQVNVHVGCALQRCLLETYPKKVSLIASEVSQQSPDIFVKLGRMTWNDIRRAIVKMKDLRAFQWASNDGISGPSSIPRME